MRWSELTLRNRASPDGDTRFPAIDPVLWRAGTAEHLPADTRDSVDTNFVVYERIVPGQPG